ncbi:MAG: response regulator, partial [Bacteroidota bacterium]
KIGNKRGQIFAISGILDADIPALEKDTLLAQGLDIALSWGDTSLLYLLQAQQAIFLAESGKLTEAVTLADQVDRGLQALNSLDNNNVNGYLLQVYTLAHRPQKGIELAKRHLAAAEKRGNQEIAQYTRKFLLGFYQKIQQKEAYFDIARTYYPLQDSLDHLQEQNRLAYLDASLADLDQQQQIAQLNADIQRRKANIFYSIVGGVCLILLLVGILLFRIRQLNIQEALTQELQLTTKELERANGELKELDGMKNRFFANVSHELRTPLTLISGPIQRLVKRENLSPQGQQEARVIQRNSRILQRRVNEILDLTKMDAERLELEPVSTQMVPYIRRILALFESYADQKDIRLELQTEVKEEIWASLDAKKTETILTNYLHNALKFTPRRGAVHLAFTMHDNRMHWSVKDTGPGLEALETEKVFDRFYQVRQKDNRATGGTGIGLALSKDLAALMRGKVWAESEVGHGSTFHLEVPFEPAQQAPKKDEISLSDNEIVPVNLPFAPILKKNQRILVVEDNYDLQIYLQGLLSDYQVFKADHGQEALDFLAENTVDLIISDVMMPVMDGLELVKHLKDAPPLSQIPIIMLTARAGLSDKLEGLRVGVDDYMVKPFVEEELQARIENALQRVALREQTESEPQEEAQAQSPVQVWLREVEQVVTNRLSQMDFNLDLVAQDLFISRRQLQRRLKAATGMTPSQYVREMRLHEARTLLESGQYQTVAEVCAAVGLEHQHYFSQQYFKRFGKKPSEYFS